MHQLLHHADEEGARIFTPDSILAAAVRDERAGKLLHVVVVRDLPEQIPLSRLAVERVENHIASGLVESTQIAAVWISNDRPITSCQSSPQQRKYPTTLTRPCRPDKLEMLGFVLARNG